MNCNPRTGEDNQAVTRVGLLALMLLPIRHSVVDSWNTYRCFRYGFSLMWNQDIDAAVKNDLGAINCDLSTESAIHAVSPNLNQWDFCGWSGKKNRPSLDREIDTVSSP
jgi:hypothetical protein